MSAETTVTVVLLVGAEGDAPQGAVLGSEATPLASLLAEHGDALDLVVVSLGTSRAFAGAAAHLRLDDGGLSPLDRLLAAVGAYALHTRFDTFPIGRLLNSLGPVAPSRVFWRTLKRRPNALSALRAADVVIASDLETTKAAWIAVHRGWVESAHYDHRALAIAGDPPPAAA